VISNKQSSSFFKITLRIFSVISFKNKMRYLFLIGYILLTSFFELLSIGAVIPFLAALSDPVSLYAQERLSPIWHFLNINSYEDLPFILSISFGFLALVAAAARISMVYLSALVNRSIIVEFGHLIFYSLIHKPFKDHFKENSSHIIGVVTSKITLLSGAISALTSMFSGALIMLSVILFILFIEPEIIISLLIIFLILYFLIIRSFNNILSRNSVIAADNTSDLIQIVRETIDGIREIILNQSHEFFIDSYDSKNYKLRTAQAKNSIISVFPRFLIEGVGIFCIAIFAYVIIDNNGSINAVLPTMAVIVMATQRLLPLGQQVYNGWAFVNGSNQSIVDTLNSIDEKSAVNTDQHVTSLNNLSFSTCIEFENVNFGYEDNQKLFSNLNFKIPKGSSVGIYGQTGSGKSTFTDLIMGFQMPDSGKIKIDDKELNQKSLREWQSKISHVPQNIFIKDSDIRSNITMSSQNDLNSDSDSDSEIEKVAIQSQLINFINSLPQRFNTEVGEGGSSLSGGQIQRIGIARAIFKKSEVIVLDEPTSALDNETEKKIMDTIYALPESITLFIVSHNLSVIEKCDIKIHLDGQDFKIINNKS
jgi:ATP-binding cassette subfamily B protein|tara:strand:+ start:993 stop:2771 length:1779 start_codon:yes stop_codon:yes gene_type:complete